MWCHTGFQNSNLLFCLYQWYNSLDSEFIWFTHDVCNMPFVRVIFHSCWDSEISMIFIIGCILFQNLTNLDRSRFVGRDQSSPVKKNAQIFLVVVGLAILFSSVPNVCIAPQTTPSFTRKNRLCLAAQMGVASQIFLRGVRAGQIYWERGAFRSDQSRFVRFWKWI